MRILIWIVRIVLVTLLVWFAAKNSDQVTLHGFPGQSLTAPLVLIALAFFGGGLLLGLLASVLTIVGLKREVRKLNRSLQQKSREPTIANPVASAAITLPPAHDV